MCVGSTYVGLRAGFSPHRIIDSRFHEWILDSNCTSTALDLDLLPSGCANHQDEYRGISVSELRSRSDSSTLTVSWWGKFAYRFQLVEVDFFWVGILRSGGLIICCNLTGDCWTLAWTFAWVHASQYGSASGIDNLVGSIDFEELDRSSTSSLYFPELDLQSGVNQLYLKWILIGILRRKGLNLCPIKLTGAQNSNRRSDLS